MWIFFTGYQSYYLVNNNSLYFVRGHNSSSTNNSNLSQLYLMASNKGLTLLQYAKAFFSKLSFLFDFLRNKFWKF